jgi:hypothetical protein
MYSTVGPHLKSEALYLPCLTRIKLIKRQPGAQFLQNSTVLVQFVVKS